MQDRGTASAHVFRAVCALRTSCALGFAAPGWSPMRLLTDLLWKLQCRLNRRLLGSPKLGAGGTVAFVARGASRDPFSAHTAGNQKPFLCVVITTHARVEPCRSLLEQLGATLAQAELSSRVFVLVLEDPSDHDYAPVLSLLAQRFPERFAFLRATRRLGKAGRAFGYQTAFEAVRALSPEFTLFLEDDAVLGLTFVSEALARWREIDDAQKTVLYLCRFDDDEPNGRWVRFARRVVPPGRVQLTQWFDLHAFLVSERFFACLDYTLFQPWPSRWSGEPSRSSGVSEQFTLRLFGRGHVYQVCETLALHGGVPSVLNAEARDRRALNNHPRPQGGDRAS
jgi:hypothetical protein